MLEIDYSDDEYYLDPYEELLEEYNYAYCVGVDHGAYDYIGGYDPHPEPPSPLIDEVGYSDGYWDGYDGKPHMLY